MKALLPILLLVFSLTVPLGAAEDVTAAVPETASEVAHSGDDGGGKNKFTMITEKFGIKLPTLIAQMVNFCVVAFVLYRFAVKPVAATLEERQQKISDGLQYAEEMKEQLAQAERERSEKVKEAAAEAQRILGEAREQSKEMIDKKTQEASSQAESILRKAREAAEQEREKMLSDVRQEVAQLVVSTSAKVLSRELSEDEKRSFAESAAGELADARN